MSDTSQPYTGQPPSANAMCGAFQDRFARNFAAAASVLLRTDVAVSPRDPGRAAEPTALRHGTCRLLLGRVAGSEAPSETVPAVQRLYLELSRELAFAMVDLLLGGPPGACHPPDRSLSAVERRVVQHLAGVARASLTEAWPQDVPALAPPAGDAEGEPQDDPGAAGGASVAAAFVVTLGSPAGPLADAAGAGPMWLHVPAWALPSHAPPTRPGRDAASPVEVSAELPETALPAEDLANLRPGDLLASDAEADGEVIVRVAGVPRFIGRIGRHNGRRAVIISRRLEDAQPDAADPAGETPPPRSGADPTAE